MRDVNRIKCINKVVSGMLISIITVTLNSAKTLRDTFDSILAQSYKRYECIVIDGGSDDATVDIIKEYENKFDGRMKWVSAPDKGPYDAMNKGILMSSGDVVGILNSDDLYNDGSVLEIIADTIEHKNVDCVFGDLLYVDSEDTMKIRRIWKGSPYKEGVFLKGWSPAHPTFYVKREIFERFGLYNTCNKISADFELMLVFLGKYRIKSFYIPRCLVKMRVGGISNRSINNVLNGNRNIVHVLRENGYNVSFVYTIRRIAPKLYDLMLQYIRCFSLGLKSPKTL